MGGQLNLAQFATLHAGRATMGVKEKEGMRERT